MGAAVEAVADTPLDAYLEADVFGPLGMRDTRFNPRGPPAFDEAGRPRRAPESVELIDRASPAPAETTAAHPPPVPLDRIAPTEVDTVFRHTHVHGYVHDENAFAMGGVAGHAGLFSTAPDLARFAGMLLRAGRGDTTRIASPETVARFVAPQPNADRALGWDAAAGTSIAAPFSRRAFGHTGFTGTSLWIDPARDLYVILLTNRVDPSRDGPSISDLRLRVHQLAVKAWVGP
jgi:CubicO group peptidase (beta-lactamase class C family)